MSVDPHKNEGIVHSEKAHDNDVTIDKNSVKQNVSDSKEHLVDPVELWLKKIIQDSVDDIFSPHVTHLLPNTDIWASFEEVLEKWLALEESDFLEKLAFLGRKGDVTSEPNFLDLSFEALFDVPVDISNQHDFLNLTLEELFSVPVSLAQEAEKFDFSELAYDELFNVAVEEGSITTSTTNFNGNYSIPGSEPNNLDSPNPPAAGPNAPFLPTNNPPASPNTNAPSFGPPAAFPVSIFLQQSELTTNPYVPAALSIFLPDPPLIIYRESYFTEGGGHIVGASFAVNYPNSSVDMSYPGVIIFTVNDNYFLFFTQDVPFNVLDNVTLPLNNTAFNPDHPGANPAVPNDPPIDEGDSNDNIVQNFENLFGDFSAINDLGSVGVQIQNYLTNLNGTTQGGPPNNNVVQPNNAPAEIDALGLPTHPQGNYYLAGDFAFLFNSPVTPSSFPRSEIVTIEGVNYHTILFNFTLEGSNGLQSSSTFTIYIADDKPDSSDIRQYAPTNSIMPSYDLTGSLITSSNDVNPNYFGADGGMVTNVSINGGTTAVGSNSISVIDPEGNFLIVDKFNGDYQYIITAPFYNAGTNEPFTQNFTFELTDNSGDVTTSVLTLVGTPYVTPANFSWGENLTLIGLPPSLFINDVPASGLFLVMIPETLTSTTGAQLVVKEDGGFTFTPTDVPDGGTQTETFIVQVSDDQGGISEKEVTFLVVGAPIANDDTATTNEDNPVSVNAAIGLINNDLFFDNSKLVINQVNGDSNNVGKVFSLASGASLEVQADGSFSYNPNGKYDSLSLGDSTTETFTYQLRDVDYGLTSNTATVNLTINGVNDAPITQDQAFSVSEDSGNTLKAFPGDDIDSDDNPATLTYKITTPLSTGEGTVINNNDGTFTYNPGSDFQDLDDGETKLITFQYQASDQHGANSNISTVSITVTGANDAPIAQDDVNSTDEDTKITVPATGVLVNDSDPDIEPITVGSVEGGGANVGVDTVLASGAVVNLKADGSYTYDPNGKFESLALGQSTTDSFNYQNFDGDLSSNTSSVTITINGVNDAPITQDQAFSVSEDSGNTLKAFPGDDIDSDDNPATLTYKITTPLSTGEGTVINNNDGTFTYNPGSDFQDLDDGETKLITFQYQASDQHGANSNISTVSITVTGANDAPIAQDDVNSTNEDTKITVLATGVLVNDSDPDIEPITVGSVEGSGANVGVDTVLASGAIVNLKADGSYTYDPNGKFESLALGQSTTDSFSYQNFDGNLSSNTSTVTININGVNDTPIAINDSGETNSNLVLMKNIAQGVLSNDIDPDAGAILKVYSVNGSTSNVGNTISLSSGALLTLNEDGSYSYDPNGQFDNLGKGNATTDTFNYSVIDEHNAISNIATVTETINGIDNITLGGSGPGTTFVFVDTPKVIDKSVTIGGSLSSVKSATIQITGNYSKGEDILDVSTVQLTTPFQKTVSLSSLGLTQSFDSNTGTLTISSVNGKTAEIFEDVLSSVTFGNLHTASTASDLDRTITWKVFGNDFPQTESNTFNSSIDVITKINTFNDPVIDSYANSLSTNSNDLLTLRELINYINTDNPNYTDPITLQEGTYIIQSGSTFLNPTPDSFRIINDMSIEGAGLGKTTISANGHNLSVFSVGWDAPPQDSPVFSLSNLTIDGTTGSSSVYARADLTLDSVDISNNGALRGGALYFISDKIGDNLLINNSTFDSNSASDAGGAIWIQSTENNIFNIINTTISGGTASNSGAGVWFNPQNGSTLNIINSTLSGNNATVGGAIEAAFNDGSAILNILNSTITNNSSGLDDSVSSIPGTINIGSTILADNANKNDMDILWNTLNSLGYNLLGSQGSTAKVIAAFPLINLNNDIVGTDVTPVEAFLAALADNGGDVKTHAFLSGSPALDAGTTFTATPNTDERGNGFNRTIDLSDFPNADSGTDIGSYEHVAPIALNDNYNVLENLVLNVPAIGVLSNDIGMGLSVAHVNGLAANLGTSILLASGALVQVDADGKFTYNPNGQFDYLNDSESALDSFTYTLADQAGVKSNPATVNVTVQGVDNPLLSNIDDFTYVFTDAARIIDSDITLSSNINLKSASIQITGNYSNGQDVLDANLIFLGGGSKTWDASTGTLTITGAGTVAEYEALLESVTIGDTKNHTTANTSNLDRTLTWTLTNQNNVSSSTTSSVKVITEVNTFLDDSSFSGPDNFLTLRNLITYANTSDLYDDITLGAGTYLLDGASLPITDSLNFIGAGMDQTFIDGQSKSLVLAATGSAFGGGQLFLQDLSIQNGLGGISGTNLMSSLTLDRVGIYNNNNVSGIITTGGGIDYQPSGLGTLTITNSYFSGNTSKIGGAIYTTEELHIANTTFSNNTGVTRSNAIELIHEGNNTILNTTITGNSGGGASFTILGGSGNTTILNSTIADNSTPSSLAGGLQIQSGVVYLGGNIIANNSSSSGTNPDVNVIGTGTLVSQGYNLIGQASGSVSASFGATDQVGTSGSPIDPLLDVLANNGGSVPTRALLTGSPAIDQGNTFSFVVAGDTISSLATDARGAGFDRIIDVLAYINAAGGNGTDIGAYEIQNPLFLPVVFDLDGNGVQLISAYDSNKSMNLIAGQAPAYVGWAAPSDGVLVYQYAGEAQLSVNQVSFVQHTPGATSDLEGLKIFDVNQDNEITLADPIFKELTIWQDINNNGLVDNQEMKSLEEWSIRSLSIQSDKQMSFENGNVIFGSAYYETTDGHKYEMADVGFQVVNEDISTQDVFPEQNNIDLSPLAAANQSVTSVSTTGNQSIENETQYVDVPISVYMLDETNHITQQIETQMQQAETNAL